MAASETFDSTWYLTLYGSACLDAAAALHGANVVAVTSRDKIDAVKELGCERALDRNTSLRDALGEDSVDLIVDNVAGSHFGVMPKLLRRGGRYVSSWAIGGPIVSFDMRDFYLKDLTLIGCTAWDEPVFPNLVSYIERGDIRPLLARTFPLAEIADAQREFLRKQHIGNFALMP